MSNTEIIVAVIAIFFFLKFLFSIEAPNDAKKSDVKKKKKSGASKKEPVKVPLKKWLDLPTYQEYRETHSELCKGGMKCHVCQCDNLEKKWVPGGDNTKVSILCPKCHIELYRIEYAVHMPDKIQIRGAEYTLQKEEQTEKKDKKSTA